MRGFKAFTLVEVLVSIAILGFLIAGIFGVLNIGTMTYNTNLGRLDLQQNARQAMYWMVRELREASAGEVNIEPRVDSLGNYDRITFNTPNESSIRYYRDGEDIDGNNIGTQIIREYPAGTYRILANDIHSLSFSLSGDVVESQLTAKKTVRRRDLCFPAPCQNPPKTLKEKVRLRN